MGIFDDIFGKETTTTTQPHPRSKQQIALEQQAKKLGKIQLKEIGRQRKFQQGLQRRLGVQEKRIGSLIGRTGDRVGDLDAELDDLFNFELEGIGAFDPKFGGLKGFRFSPTGRERSLINREARVSENRVMRQAREGLQSGLEMLREELAPSLGLSASDAPIVDRGGRIARDVFSAATGSLGEIESQRLNALLNFPLARSQLALGRGNLDLGRQGLRLQGQGLGLSGQQLRLQQALGLGGIAANQGSVLRGLESSMLMNRLNPRVQAGQLGLGLASIGPGNALAAMQAGRGSTTTSDQGGSFLDLIKGVGTILPIIPGF